MHSTTSEPQNLFSPKAQQKNKWQLQGIYRTVQLMRRLNKFQGYLTAWEPSSVTTEGTWWPDVQRTTSITAMQHEGSC